jgi:hypothetical protein
MASLTVTNLQATAMNALDQHGDGGPGGVGTSALVATGGGRLDPLPHPFQHIELEASGGADASTQTVHPRDMRHKAVPWLSMEPGEEWNMLVQAGKVSLSTAAADGDVEEGLEALW